VIIYEYLHNFLGVTHWGEAIRRLNTLGIFISQFLNILRGQIIIQYLTSKYKRSPAQSEFATIISDKNVQLGIRDRLVENKVFMKGIRLLNDLEERKYIFNTQRIYRQEKLSHRESLDGGTEDELLSELILIYKK